MVVGRRFGCHVAVGAFGKIPVTKEEMIESEYHDDEWSTACPMVFPYGGDVIVEKDLPKSTLGIALQLTGGHSALRFRDEEGGHIFVYEEKTTKRALVRVFEKTLEDCWVEIASLLKPDFKVLETTHV